MEIVPDVHLAHLNDGLCGLELRLPGLPGLRDNKARVATALAAEGMAGCPQGVQVEDPTKRWRCGVRRIAMRATNAVDVTAKDGSNNAVIRCSAVVQASVERSEAVQQKVAADDEDEDSHKDGGASPCLERPRRWGVKFVFVRRGRELDLRRESRLELRKAGQQGGYTLFQGWLLRRREEGDGKVGHSNGR